MATKQMEQTAPSIQKVSRTALVDLMRYQSNGRFLTVTFQKKNEEERTMNCKVAKGQTLTNLGYLPVKETRTKSFKNVDPRTLRSVRIGGTVFQVK
jgi:hypothetical protein